MPRVREAGHSSDAERRWHEGTKVNTRASVVHRYVDADATLAAFDTQDADSIMATLKSHEFLATALTGTHNDLVFIARSHAASSVRVRYVDPGGAAALSVSVATNDITVNLAHNGSAITSTAAQVKAAIEAFPAASALVAVVLAPSNDGTGVVTALAFTDLDVPQGTTPTLDVKLQTTVDGTVWFDVKAFTQKATTVGAEAFVFGLLGKKCRWVLDRGADADERFAISIVAEQKR